MSSTVTPDRTERLCASRSLLFRKAVFVLDQQPLFVGSGTDQGKRALELLPAQEHTLSFPSASPCRTRGLGFGTIAEGVLLILVRRIDAAIPDDHLACAVLFGGNDALERGVIERVILHLNGHPLVGPPRGRAPWALPTTSEPHRAPAGSRSAKRRAAVFLDHEQQGPLAAGAHFRCWLRGVGEAALGGVAVKGPLHELAITVPIQSSRVCTSSTLICASLRPESRRPPIGVVGIRDELQGGSAGPVARREFAADLRSASSSTVALQKQKRGRYLKQVLCAPGGGLLGRMQGESQKGKTDQRQEVGTWACAMRASVRPAERPAACNQG